MHAMPLILNRKIGRVGQVRGVKRSFLWEVQTTNYLALESLVMSHFVRRRSLDFPYSVLYDYTSRLILCCQLRRFIQAKET